MLHRPTGGPETGGPTDRQMDRPKYRHARMHLKTEAVNCEILEVEVICVEASLTDTLLEKHTGRQKVLQTRLRQTDRLTDSCKTDRQALRKKDRQTH